MAKTSTMEVWKRHFRKMAEGELPHRDFYPVTREPLKKRTYSIESPMAVSPVEADINRARARIQNQYGGGDDVLQHISKGHKNKAKALYRHIGPSLTWNQKGEIMYKGQTVYGSDIGRLIEDAVKSYSNETPVGKDVFYQALADMDIPDRLIHHKLRLLDMEKLKRSKFGPPGKRRHN